MVAVEFRDLQISEFTSFSKDASCVGADKKPRSCFHTKHPARGLRKVNSLL